MSRKNRKIYDTNRKYNEILFIIFITGKDEIISMYEVLEQIGLSRNESKAYLALLELGSTSAGRVAKKTRLDRANIYDSLEKLKLKSAL